MGYENIDKYGHCVSCHRNLTIERVVDGKVMTMFLPDKEETEFLLDDGSRMRVCICRQCKQGKDLTDPKLQETIMEAVINGWDMEVKSLVKDDSKPDWTPDRAKDYMDVYSRKKMILHNESVDKHVVEDKVKEIRENRIKEIKEENVVNK